jgi:predicted metallo-beta-lactamase superfamily hydrolase
MRYLLTLSSALVMTEVAMAALVLATSSNRSLVADHHVVRSPDPSAGKMRF